jgi:hypothetical protein
VARPLFCSTVPLPPLNAAAEGSPIRPGGPPAARFSRIAGICGLCASGSRPEMRRRAARSLAGREPPRRRRSRSRQARHRRRTRRRPSPCSAWRAASPGAWSSLTAIPRAQPGRRATRAAGTGDPSNRARMRRRCWACKVDATSGRAVACLPLLDDRRSLLEPPTRLHYRSRCREARKLVLCSTGDPSVCAPSPEAAGAAARPSPREREAPRGGGLARWDPAAGGPCSARRPGRLEGAASGRGACGEGRETGPQTVSRAGRQEELAASSWWGRPS